MLYGEKILILLTHSLVHFPFGCLSPSGANLFLGSMPIIKCHGSSNASLHREHCLASKSFQCLRCLLNRPCPVTICDRRCRSLMGLFAFFF